MKYRLIIGLLILYSILLITSCKKGENDPFFSLMSRKARIAGEWELTEATYNIANIEIIDGRQYRSTYNSVYKNGTETYTEIDIGYNERKGTYKYKREIHFDKKGNYKTIYKDESLKYESTGYWAFLSKNKEADLKNKEAIALATTSGNFSSNIYTYAENYSVIGFNVTNTYLIDRLTNKELVLMINLKTIDNIGNTTDEKIKLTYKAK